MSSTTGAPPSKTDLMYEIVYNPDFVPLPSPKVNVKITVVDNKPSYLMKNHATGIYYNLDELTNYIWNVVDGKRTVKQIVKEVQSWKSSVKERTVLEMLLFFAEANTLKASLELPPKKRLKVISAFEVDYVLIENSKNFLQSIHSKLKPIFKQWLLWVTIALIIIGAILFAGDFVSIFGRKANFEIIGSSVVGFFFYFFVALAPVIAIHEIAHGLALVHYGGQPGEMGMGLFYLGPMFYTDTTDGWGLTRGNRIMIYLAGNITTLLIGTALVIARLIVKIPDPFYLIVTMMAFYCFNMSLFNFAPPFETDGYYILSDIVKMPYLRQDSYGYVGSIFRRMLGMEVKSKTPKLTKQKRTILVGYAALSVTWIIYIVFQSSLFLVYMGQDVMTAIGNILKPLVSSGALPAAAVLIALLSTLYFGMQIVGYGFLFSAAVKKATKKPLQVDAIHDRDLAVFAYLPPHVSESISKSLRAKMETVARKFTSNIEIKQIGGSCVAVLRIGGTSLAMIQIKEHLKHIESEFNSAYEDILTRYKDSLQRSVGIYSPQKIQLTTMFGQLADESAAAGNSGARSIAGLCEEKQNEVLLYLLESAFGTVWTIEVQPAQKEDIEREMMQSLLLEDLTLTDLYKDCENFKKSVVYGFDSLAKLAEETDLGVREGLARPEKFQLVSLFEPIKSRIVFVGRTERIENHIHEFAPLFVAQTWSGYLDNLLSETCFTLSALSKASLPSAKEIKQMSIGELAVLTKDLSAFAENQGMVDKVVQESEKHVAKVNQTIHDLRTILKPTDISKIAILDAAFHVNIENLENLPKRIKDFKKEWKMLCMELQKIREHVEKEYDERKIIVTRKKRRMIRAYPVIIALSAILVGLSFQPVLLTLWVPFVGVAWALHALYWAAFIRVWRSFHTVTKYSSQAFNRIHLFLLALTQAIFGYVTTEDILTL